MIYTRFDPQVVAEIEERIKKWLPLDGKISLQVTQDTIKYLEKKPIEFSKYAYSQLSQYVYWFGESEASRLFTKWFIGRFGKPAAIESGLLFTEVELFWRNIKFEPNSVFEKIERYRKNNNLKAIQVLSQLSPTADPSIRRTTVKQLAKTHTPKTEEGIEALAYELELNKDFLMKVLKSNG
jgi:hypothetical protein